MPDIRLNRSQMGKLKRLMNMPYKPAEIAAEIGMTSDTVYRSHIPSGAPVEIDKSGSIWINGAIYANWIRNYYSARKSRTSNFGMADNQAYCFKCGHVTEVVKSRVEPFKRNIWMLKGRCKVCNCKVNRFLPAESGGKHD